ASSSRSSAGSSSAAFDKSVADILLIYFETGTRQAGFHFSKMTQLAPEEFSVTVFADEFSIAQLHGFTFNPSLAAAFRCRSSKLKKIFDSKISAAATCSKSKLRVPSAGVWRSLNC